jgi:hypothetical protein
MNCKKAEEWIVLNSELTREKKSQLEAHLKNCATCSALSNSIQNQQEIFRTAKSWNPEIENPVVFTDQIMDALPAKTFQPMKKESSARTLFQWTPLQTGLAACSLVLAFIFAVEFNRTTETIQDQSAIKNGVTLSSDPEKLIQAKRSRTERFSLEKMIHQNNTFALSKY